MPTDVLTKRQYPAIDIMKFVMALLVIILHRNMFPNDMEFANFITGKVICRMGVPFFFIVSSFLLFKKTDPKDINSKSAVWNTEKRLILLYTIWSIIYIPCNFVKSFTGHYNEITLGGLLGQVMIWAKDFLLEHSFLHLWYINALIFAIFIIYIAMKKLSSKTITIICLVLTVVAMLADNLILNIDDVLPKPIYKFFISSGFCVSLGAFIAKNDLKAILNKKWVLLSVSFAAMIIAGIFRYNSENPIFFVLTEFLAYITSFFVVLVCIDSDMKTKKYHKNLRNYSSLLYFSHFLIMEQGFNYIAFKTGISEIATYKPIIFLITIAFSFSFSFIIINLSKVKGFRWLKWLY